MTFDEIEVPQDCDQNCPYLIETPDGFSTGDSPTLYECNCNNAAKCPVVLDSLTRKLEN